MLRFVVAGMAVVILALAGVTGFLAYENLSEDDGGGTTRGQPTTPTGWEAVSYKEQHDICYEFASTREHLDDKKYQACMSCGPEKVECESGTLLEPKEYKCWCKRPWE
jgi:hypothetical protein